MPEYASRVADSNARWIPHPNFKHDQKQIPMPKVTTDAAMTSEMIAILRETMAKSHASGQTKRGAHAKSHGLLKAQFVVHDDIPNELKVGFFREPKDYAALIRSSGIRSSWCSSLSFPATVRYSRR